MNQNWKGFLPENSFKLKSRTAPSETVPQKALLILCSFELSPKENELLGKMMAAIDLSSDDFELMTSFDGSDHRQAILHIGEEGKYAIPDLSEILKNPNLKRTAWEVLKKLKSECFD